ncbi:MAG: glycosyltransferase, partial [Candidatus Limnocylindrales bacterium]
MRLSICIATMNRSETLGDTLRSIVAQLPGDVEIVLVDGSEDSRSETVFGAVTRQMTACRYLRRAPQGVDRDYAA